MQKDDLSDSYRYGYGYGYKYIDIDTFISIDISIHDIDPFIYIYISIRVYVFGVFSVSIYYLIENTPKTEVIKTNLSNGLRMDLKKDLTNIW